MKLFVDLHIHTALSPCGHEDMTPNNIVAMAVLKGLDAIAITDHNSMGNVEVCQKIGNRNNLIVIPGMELTTREEVHVICLFENLEKAREFETQVVKLQPCVRNRTEILGNQWLFNERDEIVEEVQRLLITSVDISFDEAFQMVHRFGGTLIPAHIDRPSYSLIANLGFIPDYLNIRCLEYSSEISIRKLVSKGIISENYKFIRSSDAHFLQDILERENVIEVEDRSAKSILMYIGDPFNKKL